jgi:GT2 family glycosyltransferase
MPQADADIGVVIVTYNSAGEIGDCLESLKAASTRPLSIVVVDNASPDGTLEKVRQFPDVEIISNNVNRYYAAANNQGVARVAGRHILLLNPDVMLPVSGADALAAVMDSDERLAAVAPMLVDPSGKRQQSLREFPGFDTLWYDLLGLSYIFPRSPRFGRWRMGYFDGKSERDVPQPMASCLMIRRSVLAEIGFFDERYPMFFNDVDWCKRVHDRNWRIRYTPDVQARHIGGASTRQRKLRMIWMSHTAYLQYLRHYHASTIGRRLALYLSAPVLYFAAALRSIWWGFRRTVGK